MEGRVTAVRSRRNKVSEIALSSSDLLSSDETKITRATLQLLDYVYRHLESDKKKLQLSTSKAGDSPTSQNSVRKVAQTLEDLTAIVRKIDRVLRKYEKIRTQELLGAIGKNLSGTKQMAERYLQEAHIHLAELSREKSEMKKVESSGQLHSEKIVELGARDEEDRTKKTASCCFFPSSSNKKSKQKAMPLDLSKLKQNSEEKSDSNRIDTISVEEGELTDIQVYRKLIAIQEKDIEQSISLSNSVMQQFSERVFTASYAINRDAMFNLVRLIAAISHYKVLIAEAKGLGAPKNDDWAESVKGKLKKFSCSELKHGWDYLYNALKQLKPELKSKLIDGSYSATDLNELLTVLLPLDEVRVERKNKSMRLMPPTISQEKSDEDVERARLNLNSPRS